MEAIAAALQIYSQEVSYIFSLHQAEIEPNECTKCKHQMLIKIAVQQVANDNAIDQSHDKPRALRCTCSKNLRNQPQVPIIRIMPDKL